MINKVILKKFVLLYICVILTILPSCNTLNVPNVSGNNAAFSTKDTTFQPINVVTLSRNYINPFSPTENKVTISVNTAILRPDACIGLDPSCSDSSAYILSIDGVKSIPMPSGQNTQYNYEWDGKDKNGNLVSTGFYSIRILWNNGENSTANVRDNNTYIYHSQIQVKDNSTLPEDTEFFEVNDFKTLTDYVNQLNVSTTNIDSIYDKAKQVEVNKEKVFSLSSTGRSQDQVLTNKISQLNSEITSLESDINNIAGDIMVDISSLNRRKENLANHINTITKKQYITYNPADIPDSIGSYSDFTYFSDLDINNLLGDGVTLYTPDDNDPDQENLKEAWEVDSERVEILDPTNIFDASKVLSDEIATAKDLITAFITPPDSSHPNEIYHDPEALTVLNDLINNIKSHAELLSTRAKKYSDDYNSNFEKIKQAEVDVHQSIILPLALAMEQSGEFDDNTYLHKASSMTTQGLRTMGVKEWAEWVKTKYEVTKDFITDPSLDTREKVLAIMLGYHKNEWLEFKRLDPQGATELIEATAELIEAVGIPTTATSAALTFAGPISKLFGKLSKISAQLLAKKLPSAQAQIVKRLQAGITYAKATMNKWFGKYFPKGCLDEILTVSSFHTHNFSIQAGRGSYCDISLLGKKIKISIAQKSRKLSVKTFNSTEKNAIDQLIRALEQDLSKNGKILPVEIKNKINSLKNNGLSFDGGGFPIFDDLRIGKFDLEQGEKFLGGRLDFKKADRSESVWVNLCSKSIIPASKCESPYNPDIAESTISKLRSELQLTWHHNQNLKTLELVPTVIHHKGIPHIGGDALQKFLDNGILNLSSYSLLILGKF